jgi:hypothetical protein
MSKEDKNQNGKRNNEMKLTGKKARKLSKKRAKIKKKDPEGNLHRRKIFKIGASSGYQNNTHGTSPWRSNIVVGDIITIRPDTLNG